MDMPFKPRNELEKQLLDAQEGRITGEQFVQQLLSAQVYMPIFEKQGNGYIQLDHRAKPLSIKTDDNKDWLVLFTSPERAGDFVKDYPGYDSGGLLAEFRWIMDKMGATFGISLNPGWPVGLELESEAIQQLIGHA